MDVDDEDGRRTLFETGPVSVPAMMLTLQQNLPNPFNAATTISYYLPQNSHVTLAVYDIAGRRVATLVDSRQLQGYREAHWNGRDASGNLVSTGTYFYRLNTEKATLSRKMILLR